MKIPFPIFGNGNASVKFHSQFSGTGMQVENFTTNIRERERELEAGIPGNYREMTENNGNGNGKFHFQILGTGMQVENSIPNFRERECE